MIGTRSRTTSVLIRAVMLVGALGCLTEHEVRAASQNQVDRQPGSSEPFVIQGRITSIQGTVVMVKLPDGFPGGPGGHPQFVTAGSLFRADVSHARVLLPDGKQNDKQPLAVGDRVLMVLTGPDSGSAEPGRVSPMYSASIVERVVQGDKLITH